MHWDVRRVRDQAAVRTEERARKVESFLNVRRDGGALQNSAASDRKLVVSNYEYVLVYVLAISYGHVPAHLLGNAHETVRENREMHGIENS